MSYENADAPRLNRKHATCAQCGDLIRDAPAGNWYHSGQGHKAVPAVHSEQVSSGNVELSYNIIAEWHQAVGIIEANREQFAALQEIIYEALEAKDVAFSQARAALN